MLPARAYVARLQRIQQTLPAQSNQEQVTPRQPRLRRRHRLAERLLRHRQRLKPSPWSRVRLRLLTRLRLWPKIGSMSCLKSLAWCSISSRKWVSWLQRAICWSRWTASTLEAQRAQALAGLAAAQAQLELVLDQVEPEAADVEAAQAAVNAAAAAYTRALEGATEEDRRAALAQLKQAEAAVTVAQAGYNRVKGNPLIAALPESLQLQQATLAVEAAQAQYDKVLKGSTADVTSGAYAQLANARAQLERLERGPEDAQIRALEAQVQQAETALYLSQLQLDKTRIAAPVDGIVSGLNVAEGAMVAPGAPVMELLSPENEIVVAVEESRLSDVEIGLPVTIRVDAYPGRTFDGQVIRVAPELNAATRTVDVTIQPVDEESLLAPGMFATVEIGQ